EVQRLVGQGPISCAITTAAIDGARDVGLDREDIRAVVLELAAGDFYKTMPAEKQPGLWQDVYHHRYHSVSLYIKLQVSFDGFAVVVQFKER
ncbi:MAG TPA: type II toxin-antitoxin system MqsR family toxin, partial [Longimicrobium sp.]|nr:type II toxin-antitoxin system MqsR family toxin [Longimicrobium sp.]